MNDAKRSALRARLVAEAARLEALIGAIDRLDRGSSSEVNGEIVYRDHMGDQGTATVERELDMTLEANERAELDEVRDALQRFEQGTYGICAGCGIEIPTERLEAVPTARLCLPCKQAEESR